MAKKKIEDKDKKIAELTELAQRVQADFENYIKRAEQEQKNFIVNANKDIIKRLLPVLDSFELALKNTQNPEEFKKGVELMHAQLFSVLGNEGLKHIEAKGQKFDPHKHEAFLQEEAEEEGVVLEELQKGYLLNDSVLRHSKVKISKKRENAKEIPDNNNKQENA